jgi:Trk K+ transport system NAD-binding subunit
MLLSARLSLIIAASAIGVRFGAITESTNAAIILIAALTATFAPLGFNTIMAETDEKKRRAKLIFGGSDLAIQVGKELRAHGDDVLFLEKHPEGAQRIRELGFDVLLNGGSPSSMMDSASDVRVDAFLALSPRDDENLEACRAARGHGVEHILSFVTEPIRVPDFRGLGVQTLTPSLHRSSLLALMARNSAMFSLLTSTEDQRDLREFILFNSNLHGKRLMDLKFPADSLVLAIRRDDELIVPHGTTKLVTGDHLTIIGNIETLPELEQLLERW